MSSASSFNASHRNSIEIECKSIWDDLYCRHSQISFAILHCRKMHVQAMEWLSKSSNLVKIINNFTLVLRFWGLCRLLHSRMPYINETSREIKISTEIICNLDSKAFRTLCHFTAKCIYNKWSDMLTIQIWDFLVITHLFAEQKLLIRVMWQLHLVWFQQTLTSSRNMHVHVFIIDSHY